jgi:CheY-like chemotaxis protein
MSNILLCVDDSVTMQTVAEITFRKSDWEYVGARNGDEAMSCASAKSPSVILVDAVLSDGSGYGLASELKAASPGAVVIMMCGNSEAYDEAKGAESGCDGHVIKPWQTDKVVEQIAEIANSGPSAGSTASAGSTPAAPKPVAPKPVDAGPPRSATLMGMPALEMPPSKPLPAGVAAIKPFIKAPIAVKPAIPAVKTPPPPTPMATKPAAPVPVPAPLAAAPVAPDPVAASAGREPMIKAQPGKPIRLVLASQAEAMAKNAAQSGGMSSDEASALGDVSREMLERIIWEVVPDLAESIIRENLDTLTAKAR